MIEKKIPSPAPVPVAPVPVVEKPERWLPGGLIKDLRATRRLAKDNNLGLLAASVAFFSLFAASPFFIMCFLGARYVLKQLIHTEQSMRDLGSLLETMVPDIQPWLSVSLYDLLRTNFVINAFGVVLLVWSTYELMLSLHLVFEKISNHEEKRHPVKSNLIALFCLGIVGVSGAVVLFLFTAQAAVLRAFLGPTFANVRLSTVNFVIGVISTFLVLGAISGLYKFLPTRPVGWPRAARGAVMFLVLFLIGRMSYQFYVAYYSFLNASTYGSFLKVMILMTWIYYLCHSFLFAAQYALYLERKIK